MRDQTTQDKLFGGYQKVIMLFLFFLLLPC